MKKLLIVGSNLFNTHPSRNILLQEQKSLFWWELCNILQLNYFKKYIAVTLPRWAKNYGDQFWIQPHISAPPSKHGHFSSLPSSLPTDSQTQQGCDKCWRLHHRSVGPITVRNPGERQKKTWITFLYLLSLLETGLNQPCSYNIKVLTHH